MPVLQKITGSVLTLWPNSEAIFQALLVCSVKRKRGREKGPRITGLFRKLSGCSDPAGLKGRQRGALSLSDKWTSSIDCKVYLWGGKQDPTTMAVFLFDTWSLNLLAQCMKAKTNPPPSSFSFLSLAAFLYMLSPRVLFLFPTLPWDREKERAKALRCF